MLENLLPNTPPLPTDRAAFAYHWPFAGAFDAAAWQFIDDGQHRIRAMPEGREELAVDSRWPAFFPSSICITTAANQGIVHVEKVVGASIVNRFPYVLALSYCREPLSDRHYVRRTFMDAIEASGRVAVQFLMPGVALKVLMAAIATVTEERTTERFRAAGLSLRPGFSSTTPIFSNAYLVYECRLVRPGRDFDGMPIYANPWIDVGSHRVYFFEIETISLNDDIASGRAPIHWRSLPVWRGSRHSGPNASSARRRKEILAGTDFIKVYRPDYVFPSPNTIAFDANEHCDGFAVKYLPPLPEDQVEVDNDLARWPCFFPSSLGLITVDDGSGRIGGMSCGSTTVIARDPLTVAMCVSYAQINERYAARASLDLLAGAERFGCGVPVYRSDVLDAIAYLGNVSRRGDPDKVATSGLTPKRLGNTIGFAELPVHYDCRIVNRFRLGTHIMFLGRVEHVLIRTDVTESQPIEWCPWAGSLKP
jgi:flavin reductase (DIM6/NTAB) family NADH-FMN oxidoreductase RutF